MSGLLDKIDSTLNILQLLLALIAGVIAIFGETWRENRLTSKGRLAIVVLLLSSLIGIYKERREWHDKKENKANQDRMMQAILGLTRIAASKAPATNSEFAALTLDRLFSWDQFAAVKVTAAIAGELREKSGFFINNDGGVLTADFAVIDTKTGARATQVKIQTADGTTFPADYEIDRKLSIAILKTVAKGRPCIDLAPHEPKRGGQVLVIGYTPNRGFARIPGRLEDFQDVYGNYSREPDLVPGFGGGPVIDEHGHAVGVNWGAPEPPVPGHAKLSRSDRIRQYLIDHHIPLCGP